MKTTWTAQYRGETPLPACRERIAYLLRAARSRRGSGNIERLDPGAGGGYRVYDSGVYLQPCPTHRMTAADLQPGYLICVNDQWTPLLQVTRQPDGSIGVYWDRRGDTLHGVRCQPTLPHTVIVR